MKYVMMAAVCALAALAAGCGESNEGPGIALTITDANFDETIKDGVALVDFWATWCPPCRTQGPIVEKVARAYEGKAVVGKLDTDRNKKTAARFKVRSIPTLIIFKDGKEVQRFTGLTQETKLKAALDKRL
jgi:thioredoxin 1